MGAGNNRTAAHVDPPQEVSAAGEQRVPTPAPVSAPPRMSAPVAIIDAIAGTLRYCVDKITDTDPRARCLIFCMFFALVFIGMGWLLGMGAHMVLWPVSGTFVVGIAGLFFIPVPDRQKPHYDKVSEAVLESAQISVGVPTQPPPPTATGADAAR